MILVQAKGDVQHTGHLVAQVAVDPMFLALTNTESPYEDGWFAFNDFTITPMRKVFVICESWLYAWLEGFPLEKRVIEVMTVGLLLCNPLSYHCVYGLRRGIKEEASFFNTKWKTPCILFYALADINTLHAIPPTNPFNDVGVRLLFPY